MYNLLIYGVKCMKSVIYDIQSFLGYICVKHKVWECELVILVNILLIHTNISLTKKSLCETDHQPGRYAARHLHAPCWWLYTTTTVPLVYLHPTSDWRFFNWYLLSTGKLTFYVHWYPPPTPFRLPLHSPTSSLQVGAWVFVCWHPNAGPVAGRDLHFIGMIA